MITLDFDIWVGRYNPEGTKDSGGHFTPEDIGFKDKRVLSHPNHIWTKFSSDEECCGQWPDCACPGEPDIFNGAGWVNRMEYYYTQIPFNPTDDIGVL